LDAVGIGFPGIIRNGVAEESPNLGQMKGFRLQNAVELCTGKRGSETPCACFQRRGCNRGGNCGDARVLHKLNRVWAIGNGVGYGRFPWSEGVWEGGHSVVTLDPKERFCGCGGVDTWREFLATAR